MKKKNTKQFSIYFLFFKIFLKLSQQTNRIQKQTQFGLGGVLLQRRISMSGTMKNEIIFLELSRQTNKIQKRTWFGLGGVLLRRRISTSGTTKARVLPKLVAASTATSLQLQSKGIVAAWIGVQNLKPAWVRASRTGSESEVEIGGARFDQRTALVGGDGIHGFQEQM